ncbi:MAG: adenine deaminase, partial [Anaerolineae bacterium]
VLGLAEMMNYPGVLSRLPAVLEMLEAAAGLPIDGHAPGLSGRGLHAYIGAGIRSDHECTTAQEALEKVRAGMHVHIRQGSAARNLMDLLPAVTPHNAGMFSFCTDDRHPAELLHEGHLDDILRKAISAGLSPITAIQMATIHTARHYRLWELGAVAPGYRADLVVLESLEQVRPQMVFQDGRLVARDGKLTEDMALPAAPPIQPTMRIAWERVSFALPAPPAGTAVRVIGIVPDQIITRSLRLEPKVEAGQITADVSRDMLKIAVVERHHATGNVGVGLVQGMGLKRGAIASSVAHDSHNIVVVGADDRSMRRAVRGVAEMGGGQVVADEEEVLARLPLPIAGLISGQPLEAVQEAGEAVRRAARALGCALSDPVMTLSFLALPVIPALKITDKGLVDVERFAIVPLWD